LPVDLACPCPEPAQSYIGTAGVATRPARQAAAAHSPCCLAGAARLGVQAMSRRPSILSPVQAFVRVIREPVNDPDASPYKLNGAGASVWPWKPLGMLLDSPGLDKIDIQKIEHPGSGVRLAVALRDTGKAIAACRKATYLQDLWKQVLNWRTYPVDEGL